MLSLQHRRMKAIGVGVNDPREASGPAILSVIICNRYDTHPSADSHLLFPCSWICIWERNSSKARIFRPRRGIGDRAGDQLRFRRSHVGVRRQAGEMDRQGSKGISGCLRYRMSPAVWGLDHIGRDRGRRIAPGDFAAHFLILRERPSPKHRREHPNPSPAIL